MVSSAWRPSGSLPRTWSARLSLAGAGSAKLHQGAACGRVVRPASSLASMRWPSSSSAVTSAARQAKRASKRRPARVQGVAEMLVDFGLRRVGLRRRCCSVSIASGSRPRLYCAQPSESVIEASSGAKRAGLADHRLGRVQVLAALELGVAEEVEEQRLVRARCASAGAKLGAWLRASGRLARARWRGAGGSVHGSSGAGGLGERDGPAVSVGGLGIALHGRRGRRRGAR